MHVVAHCRPGFESECAADLAALARLAGGDLAADVVPGTALVAGTIAPFVARRFSDALRRYEASFARAIFTGPGPLALSGRDRIAPLILAATTLKTTFGAIWLETPDTNEGKTLSGFTRRLQPLLEAAARDAGLLVAESPRRLHVLFTTRADALLGTSDTTTGPRWPMGIPRLRMPAGAPSRSALKLAEAFVTFLDGQELELVHAGMRAVDLGAAPGGWTWQLVQRGLRVTAVDNGPLKGEVAQDPLVTHLRTDGLTYRPRRPVEWMVCDIVDKPARIAALVARWIAQGDARRTIFNLKLPMKRRFEAVQQCRETIEETLSAAHVRHVLRVKQLYHDREEVTGYLARLG